MTSPSSAETKPAEIQLSRQVLKLAERYRPKPDKKQTTVRFEPWLNRALENHILTLKMRGFDRITREAVITEAVIQYLGVKAPLD